MAKAIKKRIRQEFRNAVFTRDGHKCLFCDVTENLDAHHITDRSKMPNGGYVVENGATLCVEHHRAAEVYHQSDEKDFDPVVGTPNDLYRKIGSSYGMAWEASNKLLTS